MESLLQPLQAFFGLIWLLVWTLIKIVGVMIPLLLAMAYMTLAERKVIGKVVATAPEEYSVEFRPNVPLPAVARVEFTGNEAFDQTTLQNNIGSVAYGLPFTENNFRELHPEPPRTVGPDSRNSVHPQLRSKRLRCR